MRDIIIRKESHKRELLLFLACWIVAEVLNIAAIVIYDTPWWEAFTYVGYVTCIAAVFYAILFVVRIPYFLYKHCKSNKN